MHTLDTPVFDADNHYYEALDAFTRHRGPPHRRPTTETGARSPAHTMFDPSWECDVNGIVDLKGDDRVIFGSDWPHIEGLPEPTDWVAELQKLDAPATARIMGGNVSILKRTPAGKVTA
jgi:predicted TIM-barrel fold metal-dependent hydrolase